MINTTPINLNDQKLIGNCFNPHRYRTAMRMIATTSTVPRAGIETNHRWEGHYIN
jgi:ribosomal protein L29